MAKRNKSKYVWAIGFIDKDHIFRAQDDIRKHKAIETVEVFIPTVRVLSKRTKGHAVYTNHPLMLNYGFFKVTRKQLLDYSFMNRIKESTPCISGWLKNQANAPKSKLKKNVDEALPIAYAEKSLILWLEELQKKNDVYSPFELKSITPGEVITLKCYPYEGMDAKVIKVDIDKGKVTVELVDSVGEGFEFGKGRIHLDFEHVFFTIYKSETDSDTLSKALYLEDIKIRNKSHKIFNNNENSED